MACLCSSPLLVCHVEVGCICPPGRDCQESWDTSREQLETEAEILNRLWHHLALVVGLPVSLLLLIAFSLVCCSVGYYNVKFKKMKSLITTNNTNNTSTLSEPEGQQDDTNVEVDSSPDRKSITSLSQVLSLYEAKLNSASSSVSSEERSLQLNIGSVSSQDTTISIEDENYDYLDYDHLDHNRSVNDISPNYCQY